MKLPILEIRKKLQQVLIERGLALNLAKIVADEYLEGELQGKQSHGLMAFPDLLKKIENFKNKKSKFLVKKHAFIIADANKLPGSYIGKIIADDLIKMAQTEGVAIGFIKNMTTWLRPGTIAKYVAEKNMVAFVLNNGGESMIAPPGGYTPVVGTNPIGIGIPTRGEPIVIDMATSKRAWGEVRKALKNHTNLPKESFYAPDGKFAIKPDDAYSAMPMGDYKGFALALFIEIMTGSFLGLNMNTRKARNDYRSVTRGGMILVMNPIVSTNPKNFKKANSRLIKEIKNSKKLPGVKEIQIPGERAEKTKKRNLKKGYLDIDEDLWSQITR